MGTKESKHSNSISYEDSVKRGECPPVGVLCASALRRKWKMGHC